MSGDMERAAQLVLHRQESGQSLDKSRSKNGRKFEKPVDEKSIKNRIMNQYGFVDNAEDMRYHRPTLKREVGFILCWNLHRSMGIDFKIVFTFIISMESFLTCYVGYVNNFV